MYIDNGSQNEMLIRKENTKYLHTIEQNKLSGKQVYENNKIADFFFIICK